MPANPKLLFLQNELPALLLTLSSNKKGNWGVMNGQQMVEHLTDTFKIASCKTLLARVTPEAHIEKMKAFAVSEKPFRENTDNPLLDKIPPPPRHITMAASVAELKSEIDYFVEYFSESPSAITKNPFFGDLNFHENILLLYKHVMHHLKQFNLIK